MVGGAWWAAVHGVAKSRTRLSNFTLTFHSHALEKEMATHSSVLAWRIPETEEPGRLPSLGSHRVGHDWSDLAAAAAAAAMWSTGLASLPSIYVSLMSMLGSYIGYFSVPARTPCCLHRSLLTWRDLPPAPTHCWLSTQQPSLEVSVGLFRADPAFYFLLCSLPSFLPSFFSWGGLGKGVGGGDRAIQVREVVCQSAKCFHPIFTAPWWRS